MEFLIEGIVRTMRCNSDLPFASALVKIDQINDESISIKNAKGSEDQYILLTVQLPGNVIRKVKTSKWDEILEFKVDQSCVGLSSSTGAPLLEDAELKISKRSDLKHRVGLKIQSLEEVKPVLDRQGQQRTSHGSFLWEVNSFTLEFNIKEEREPIAESRSSIQIAEAVPENLATFLSQ